MNAIILHGTGNTPEGNWFGWMAQQLEAQAWQAWVPALPEPDHPSGSEWTQYVREHAPFAIDTDPYCPLDQTQDLAAKMGAELVVIPGQGHFNLEHGPQYRQFPKLLEIIQERVCA